ncbi:DUF6387 family protein [Methylomonas sp. CM2]|uniref:DUF6387 family protein n=1 Tax=Methylomonas sp. CM2 TaxID=3417647 RepID=UPI003CF751BF
MKPNKLDTSWFDLNNYDALKTMQIGGWIEVIETRIMASNPHYDFFTKDFVKQVKSGNPIIDSSNYQAYLQEELAKSRAFQKPYSTASVNSISTYNLWHLTRELHHPNPNEEHISQLSYLCQLKSKMGRTHDKMNLTLNPYEINIHEAYYPDQPVGEAYVKINLMATDDQIKKDFSHWLKYYRSRAGSSVIQSKNQKAKKVEKVFDSVDFKKWIEYQVIPYADLIIVSQFEENELTVQDIGDLLFPYSHFDRSGKIKGKSGTKKKFEEMKKEKWHETLKSQLLKEKIVERRITDNC